MTSISLSSVSSQITNNIFSKLDTSNQGTIDATSLSKALSESADDQASDEVSDLVSSIDTDGDSKISKSELTKGIENLFSQLQSASNQAGGAPGGPPHRAAQVAHRRIAAETRKIAASHRTRCRKWLPLLTTANCQSC